MTSLISPTTRSIITLSLRACQPFTRASENLFSTTRPGEARGYLPGKSHSDNIPTQEYFLVGKMPYHLEILTQMAIISPAFSEKPDDICAVVFGRRGGIEFPKQA